MALLTITGVQVANPAEIKVGRFDLTKSSRTASGRMVMELIATKRRVDVTWKMLADDQLKQIIDLITAHKPFFTLTYPDAGGTASMTCYAGDINTSLWHTVGGIRYWSEVTIPFIEQ
ncbi:hypothetical protein [Marinobacter sp.]|uniref:hypothetical protein n=1 Tax=Marinobacter sp. TaxID=50741 RepID=UPI001987237F|nr:hypothetical protein [Marinobacter sp.]MBC7193866.1 hypothetical protein [Marinobacter sp.]